MGLNQITIRNVRNIREARVQVGPRLNIFFGDNGSGKSSLLESIHLLGRATSFRTKHITEVINEQAKELFVAGNISDQDELVRRVAIRLGSTTRRIQVDDKEVRSRVELLECLPLQFISPLSYLLIEGPPTLRRQFIDWGVFHLDEGYAEEWRRFKRCLVQRNSALKCGFAAKDEVWTAEFAKYGTIIACRREQYLNQFRPYLEEIGEELLASHQVAFQYDRGWDWNQDLDQTLVQDYRKDLKFGFTHSGPHKSDLMLKVHGRPCKSFLSRGQIKILVLALKLAQIKLLIQRKAKSTSLLIDDFCAELDRGNSKKLKDFLAELKLQSFITSTDRESIGALCDLNTALFHVEHGQIRTI